MRVLGCLVLLLSLASVKADNEALSRPGLWPNPSSAHWGNENLSLNYNTFGIKTPSSSEVLKAAILRYKNLLAISRGIHRQIVFPPPHPTKDTVDDAIMLIINVKNDTAPLTLGVNESYTMTVGSMSAISAETVWGALHALETFSQLCQWNGTTYVIQNTPLTITDTPKFPWRGYMIDTARHFFPLHAIKDTIDLLAMSKMNVLHWHMVDAEIKSRPDLQNKGAWFPTAKYSQADMAEIINYGQMRGVRVVPEVDTPGHSYSWGHAYPDITLKCSNLIQKGRDYPRINNVPLDMTQPQTYEVVEDVIREVSQVFPDFFLHLGGDEISSSCVDEFPRIKQWMKDHGMNTTSYADLVKYYEHKLIDIVAKNGGKKMIFWQEIFEMFQNNIHSTLPAGTVINVWIRERRAELMRSIVTAGYPALVSSGWYLDQQIPNINPSITHYLWLDTWQDFYNNDPMQGLSDLPIEQQKLVLGGEACQWGEQVDDQSIFSRSWPRAAATAESLWSHTLEDTNTAFHRLAVHRCRLYLRGYAVSPVRPDFCQHVN